MRARAIDTQFLTATLLLVIAGLFIFTSASLGIVVREDLSFASILLKQIAIGLFGGGCALLVFSKINYKIWRKYSFYIFIASVFVTLLVFIPGIGFRHGGAARWIELGPLTVQPAEFLKLGAVIYFAAWLSGMKERARSFQFGILPLLVLLGICGAVLLKQPDTGTFLVLFVSVMAVFIAGGGRWRDVMIILFTCALGIIILATMRPYLMDRLLTFMHPEKDAYGAGYQIQQSLIAVGAGGIFGRGFGQSIQKFSFLPEPIGDSIFAVAAEEFGFVGGVALISLFLYFMLRGFKIASRTKDPFGRLLVVGIITLVISQAFINIGAMTGILPLTGIPLTFVSQGGTALLFALAEVGIVLNVSSKSSS